MMTIKAGHLRPALIARYFFFILVDLVDYQTGLWEKYLVTGDWSQSSPEPVSKWKSSSDLQSLLHFFFRFHPKTVHRNWVQKANDLPAVTWI